MPDSDDEVSSFTICQNCCHCVGVITVETVFSGINLQIAAISANSSFVAVSVSVGAAYVPSNTAIDAGVLAVYPKSLSNVPLHMGASPARV
jgi:hypothetical protein